MLLKLPISKIIILNRSASQKLFLYFVVRIKNRREEMTDSFEAKGKRKKLVDELRKKGIMTRKY